jgi:hypothetical protein
MFIIYEFIAHVLESHFWKMVRWFELALTWIDRLPVALACAVDCP